MCEISVVIPVLNGADTLAEQIEAVLAQEGVGWFEVVVVDNGSTDGTVDLIRSYADRDERVRLVDGSAAPKGGAAAKNIGVEAAKSDLIAFCDADDVVRPGWLRAIRHGLVDNPVVIVTREYWTLNPHLDQRYQPQTGLGVPAISGGAFGIHRKAYLEIGGFDTAFRGAVDTDFGIRLRQAGYAPFPLSEAVVSIRLPTSAWQLFRRRRLLARSGGHIQRRHAIRAPEYSLSAVAKTGAALVLHAHRLLHRGRFSWAQTAGSFVGRLEVLCRLDRD